MEHCCSQRGPCHGLAATSLPNQGLAIFAGGMSGLLFIFVFVSWMMALHVVCVGDEGKGVGLVSLFDD
jgi:hypothetical protein